MNPPDLPPAPGLPLDQDGPVFAEPWQAQAFALAVRLSAEGLFTWPEWAAALSETLAGDPADDGSRYYHHWVATLERLVARHGVADTAELAERKAAWDDAYRRTPHGKPVELGAAFARHSG